MSKKYSPVDFFSNPFHVIKLTFFDSTHKNKINVEQAWKSKTVKMIHKLYSYKKLLLFGLSKTKTLP